MVSPISSASAPIEAVSLQNATPAKPHQASTGQSQDTVQLSATAQAQAAGDVDHDGDSH